MAIWQFMLPPRPLKISGELTYLNGIEAEGGKRRGIHRFQNDYVKGGSTSDLLKHVATHGILLKAEGCTVQQLATSVPGPGTSSPICLPFQTHTCE